MIDYLVEDARLYAAPSRTFEEEAVRALSAMNHFMLNGEGDSRKDLATLAAPTLVLHGTEDPGEGDPGRWCLSNGPAMRSPRWPGRRNP